MNLNVATQQELKLKKKIELSLNLIEICYVPIFTNYK